MLRGVNGQIKWSYQVAAEIKGYTVTRNEQKQLSLRATVASADPFRLTQTPLVFVATHQGGEWRWPINELVVEGNSVAAKLGPPLT